MGFTYVMSDLHGQYDMYVQMLELIDFKDDDMLYILGDIVDRGPNPIKIILDLMKRTNVEILAGNHEVMALECINKVLFKEVTDENIDELLGNDGFEMLLNWQCNGSESTTRELHKLDDDTIREVIDFMSDFELIDEVNAGGRNFVLVHAGLGNFDPCRDLWDYELHELVWEKADYDRIYFEDKYLVTGHTPTVNIAGGTLGSIYMANNHIAIDCGCSYPGGRLGCIRLDDLQEFYVE